MSLRIAKALVAYISELPGNSKFILIEGLPVPIADLVASSWEKDLPPLLVGSDDPTRFGSRALVDQSGTQIRNLSAKGVCILLCEGFQIPDWQSVAKFKSVSLSDLVRDRRGLALLAEAETPVDFSTGTMSHVRLAILEASANARPTAFQVASYFSEIALGKDPLEPLNLLCAFPDRDPADGFTKERLVENLELARRRFSDSPSSFNEIRRRAAKVFSRPGAEVRDPAHFMRLLQTGDPAFTSAITFDEAREILNDQAPDLVVKAKEELEEFRALVKDAGGDDQEELIPWDRCEAQIKQLRGKDGRKTAASDLLDFHRTHDSKVFSEKTSRKLEKMLKDKMIVAQFDSPEVALVKCASALDSPITEIRLSGHEWAGAKLNAAKTLTLALAFMRLGPLFRRIQDTGLATVEGRLLESPAFLIGNSEEDLFFDFIGGRDVQDLKIPSLQVRLMGNGVRDSVEFKWKPTSDDLALFRSIFQLSNADSSYRLMASRWPTPGGICATRDLKPIKCHKANVAVAAQFKTFVSNLMERGLDENLLSAWAQGWSKCIESISNKGRDVPRLEDLALAGTVQGDEKTFAAGLLSPLKAEWAAATFGTMRGIVLEAISCAGKHSISSEEADARIMCVEALARGSANQYPAFLRIAITDDPLLAVHESKHWSIFAPEFRQEAAPHAEEAVNKVVRRLLHLQPEAARHLKCIAVGPDAATILVRQMASLIGKRVGREEMQRCEIFCVGQKPSEEALKEAEATLGQERRHLLGIRFFKDFLDARTVMKPAGSIPVAHLALVCGLSGGAGKISSSTIEINAPTNDNDVSLTPKTWLRPKSRQKLILAPAGTTSICRSWLRIMTAIDEDWPDGEIIRVPEIQTSSENVRTYLKDIHDLALWVATVDRFASRETLEKAMGTEVAILHQECRLSSEFPLGLVISQKSGSQADRAIARSLIDAGILAEDGDANEIAQKLRTIATQGYGILALEAATSGFGINELVAHVVSFSQIQSEGVPWPFAEGCRVLLVSLDEYSHWFGMSKRADLLALALDPGGDGVYVAVIEVKARRGDADRALAEALEQIRLTLSITKAAAHGDTSLLEGRIWRNRIAEAAYSVAREINFRLEDGELRSIEAFRRGTGVLEWGGVGLVFGPTIEATNKHTFFQRYGDKVPIATKTVKLTREVLNAAVDTKLTELRTIAGDQGPLPGGRERRRPEKKTDDGLENVIQEEPAMVDGQPSESTQIISPIHDESSKEQPESASTSEHQHPDGECVEIHEAGILEPTGFQAPLLGWRTDRVADRDVYWHAAGSESQLSNPHVEIWGSSGAGKTQFTMALLAQLSAGSGCRFGIADFKNDYNLTDKMDFPTIADAKFIDLWKDGAAYNPLALEKAERHDIDRGVIELNDVIVSAARAFMTMGHRQQNKLQDVIRTLFRDARNEDRWPTLEDLAPRLDSDLRPILSPITDYPIFKAGPSLGEVINERLVFGLSEIPGSGLATVLTGGFILSSIWERVRNLPQSHSLLRYVAVVDEAHRVSKFKVIDTMLREGRSKGLGVILATQQPSDLPAVAATQAQTKICFRLDPMMAKVAAKRLDPDNRSLEETIRNLNDGEAIVKLGKNDPLLIQAVQLYRDAPALLAAGSTAN